MRSTSRGATRPASPLFVCPPSVCSVDRATMEHVITTSHHPAGAGSGPTTGGVGQVAVGFTRAYRLGLKWSYRGALVMEFGGGDGRGRQQFQFTGHTW